MNLRQKAKNYKRLCEQMKVCPVKITRVDGQRYRIVKRLHDEHDLYPAKETLLYEVKQIVEEHIKYNEQNKTLELEMWL